MLSTEKRALKVEEQVKPTERPNTQNLVDDARKETMRSLVDKKHSGTHYSAQGLEAKTTDIPAVSASEIVASSMRVADGKLAQLQASVPLDGVQVAEYRNQIQSEIMLKAGQIAAVHVEELRKALQPAQKEERQAAELKEREKRQKAEEQSFVAQVRPRATMPEKQSEARVERRSVRA